MASKPWYWVWVQNGPLDYRPADSPHDAARRFADEHKVAWDSRIHVALETETFEFAMKEGARAL
jgi:hypothetical protein